MSAEPSNTPLLGYLCVMPNPYVPGSMLVLAASGGVLSTYQSVGRGELQVLDFFPIRDIRRVHGMGLDKVWKHYEDIYNSLQTACLCHPASLQSNRSILIKKWKLHAVAAQGALQVF